MYFLLPSQLRNHGVLGRKEAAYEPLGHSLFVSEALKLPTANVPGSLPSSLANILRLQHPFHQKTGQRGQGTPRGSISSSVFLKVLSLPVLEDMVPASSRTLEPKGEGAACLTESYTRTWLPALCPDLLMSLSPRGWGGGEAEGKSGPPLKCQPPCHWLRGLRPRHGLVIAEGLKGG